MNTASFVGNVTRDCEVRKTQTGRSVCSFTVAVNRQKSADGTQVTDYIPCTAWEQTADLIGRYVRKGDRVGVTGAIQSRKTTYKGVDITSIDINVQHIDFLSPKQRENSDYERGYSGDNTYLRPQKPQEAPQRTNYRRDEEEFIPDENLPF